MDYKGYKVYKEHNKIIIENVKNFNPVHIFECGQCFRWIRQEDGSYNGVVKDNAANVRYEEGCLVIENTSVKTFSELWYDYFDLGRDYEKIKKALCKDEIMEKAILFGSGIRLLKQNLWETLISFIISTNRKIPMIMKTVSEMSQTYGSEVLLKGEKYFTFPCVEDLASTSIEKLEICKGGYRCKYILGTAGRIKNGQVVLNKLINMSTDEAREELIKLPGVGRKVADCVLLYSGTKYDVFPTDVWVKRVMEALYFKREASFSEIHNFAKEYFGDLAGFAQQYLFYYARENKIGVNEL